MFTHISYQPSEPSLHIPPPYRRITLTSTSHNIPTLADNVVYIIQFILKM